MIGLLLLLLGLPMVLACFAFEERKDREARRK